GARRVHPINGSRAFHFAVAKIAAQHQGMCKLLLSAYLRRRELIKLLGGSAAAWPLTAQAQQSERMRLVGVLMAYAESTRVSLITSKFSAGDRIHRPHLQRCEAWQATG